MKIITREGLRGWEGGKEVVVRGWMRDEDLELLMGKVGELKVVTREGKAVNELPRSDIFYEGIEGGRVRIYYSSIVGVEERGVRLKDGGYVGCEAVVDLREEEAVEVIDCKIEYGLNEGYELKRGEENFPVELFFLSKREREGTLALYRFARHADEIADGGMPGEYLRLLDGALRSGGEVPEWARGYRECVERGYYDGRHGRGLIWAFLEDLEKRRYGSWEELMGYCEGSAVPIGRMELELYGEWGGDVEGADAICKVLQVINHLQDMKEDYERRDRVYFPEGWFGDVEDLRSGESSEGVKGVVRRVLGLLEPMREVGWRLPGSLGGWKLRAKVYGILRIIDLLMGKLVEGDVMKGKVGLSKWEKVGSILYGVGRSLVDSLRRIGSGWRGVGKFIKVIRKGSSFLGAVMRLRGEVRKGMLSFYAFCRAVDDGVDEAVDEGSAVKALEYWRGEVGKLFSEDWREYPESEVVRSLIPYRRRVKREHFEEVLNGMEMDIRWMKRGRPSEGLLELYCYRVASCVGMVIMDLIGYEDEGALDYGFYIGQGLQLLNIGRDIEEDRREGREYVARGWEGGRREVIERGMGKLERARELRVEGEEGLNGFVEEIVRVYVKKIGKK